jgi:hypothetical protein
MHSLKPLNNGIDPPPSTVSSGGEVPMHALGGGAHSTTAVLEDEQAWRARGHPSVASAWGVNTCYSLSLVSNEVHREALQPQDASFLPHFYWNKIHLTKFTLPTIGKCAVQWHYLHPHPSPPPISIFPN